MSTAILCTGCGHTAWQHPDGGACRLHPRGEQQCPCEAFGSPVRVASTGSSSAGYQSILGGLEHPRAVEYALERVEDRLERERRESR